MLIIGALGSRKTNVLLNLIKEHDHFNPIDKIYLYSKDLSESKYQFLIQKREDLETKILNDPSAFVEYSNTMSDVYNDIVDYNSKRKTKILIMIADIMSIMTK